MSYRSFYEPNKHFGLVSLRPYRLWLLPFALAALLISRPIAERLTVNLKSLLYTQHKTIIQLNQKQGNN